MDTLDEKLRCLRQVGILSSASEATLAQIALSLTPVLVRAEETIFSKGEAGDALYIVAEGRVRVHDGNLLFNYLDTGHVFGEIAVLDTAPRSATVTAEVDTQLYRLSQEQIFSIMAAYPEVGRGIIQSLSGHLRARIADRTRDFAYIHQVARIAAAAEQLEAGVYIPGALDDVAQRADALGNLARVFQNMAREVYTREQRLRQQVRELRIEIDQARQARQVAEIAGSDYFQNLRQRAQELRDEIAVDGDEVGDRSSR